eukprot:gnl/MRDRNA2_/MRDRNA2_119509_c0_seq1.p1 gnl/MRDRNA2_/MRDRNA2_119509_c0~~gnl/MRDRNA2_/MRDRNA2_119509_c0_seq1.p1  ORF type:complete len:384 (-),score=55.94 gnl/MRDRNA2_/MRDRNA2_119509_c0_seq1:122-1273(-)
MSLSDYAPCNVSLWNCALCTLCAIYAVVCVQILVFDFNLSLLRPSTELHWWVLNAVPPIIASGYMLCWMRKDPRPLLDILPTLIPGLQEPQYDNKLHGVSFRFDGAHHPSTKVLGNHNLGIFLNFNDIIKLAVMPVLFINTYFWDAAFCRKYAGASYPTAQCHRGSNCFYKTSEYRLFSLKPAMDLKCYEMLQKTLEHESGFYFSAPPDAEFYTCYDWVLNFNTFIGIFGNVAAFASVVLLLILYFVITVVPNFAKSNAQTEYTLVQEIRNCWLRMMVMAVLFVLSVAVSEEQYGEIFHSIESFMWWPCCFGFGFLVFNSRRTALTQCWKELQAEAESDEEEGEEEDDYLRGDASRRTFRRTVCKECLGQDSGLDGEDLECGQ